MSIISRGAVEPPQRQKNPFYINQNYAFLWGGQSISLLGDLIFGTTLTLWIATVIARGQAWAPEALGGEVICTALPTIFVGPLAGVFVDRWDKKRTMIWMDIIRAVCVALLLLIVFPLPFLPSGHLPPLVAVGIFYAFTIATTCCTLFFSPARTSILQDIVDEKYYERASGLSMLTQNLTRIIGPSLAAPTLFVFGIQWALLIDVASFLVSIAAVAQVRPREQQKKTHKDQSAIGFWREFKDGLRYFRQSRLLLTLLVAFSFILIVEAAEQTLGVFFLIQNLHVPVYLFGIIGTIAGIGGIAGTLLAPTIVKRLGTIRSFWLGIIGIGLIFFVFSRMTLFAPALVVIFLAGFPLAAANLALGPLMLRTTPRNLIGRVEATFSTCLSVISILAVGLVTTLASLLHNLNATLFFLTFGPYDTVISIGGIITILVGIGAALSLRNVSSSQPGSEPERQEEQGLLSNG